MKGQGLTTTVTLEALLHYLALNQDDKAMHKALASLTLPTTVALERVLGSLLDPAFFFQYGGLDRYGFDEGLSKAYWRLREDQELRKVYQHSSESGKKVELEVLQGAIGLVCFTIELLNEAERRDRGHSNSTYERQQKLLNDPAVQSWFYKVYAPPSRNPVTTQNSPTKKQEANLKLSQQYWQELKLDSLKLYQVGTTSFILRCRIGPLVGEELALKCLLFPYTMVPTIAYATRDYAWKNYAVDTLLTNVCVHSSSDKWILMDFVEGLTLQEFLQERRNSEGKEPPFLRTDLIASIGKPLLDALCDMSSAGFQHEDLTPSNIIVSREPDGSVKRVVLIDPGRNYLYGRDIGLVENRESLFVAPEVKNGGRCVVTSDLYSFGMILIELADPKGARDGTIPDSIYQYAPHLTRFIEDLVDVNPEKRLLIFWSKDAKNPYPNLCRAFADELKVLPSDSEMKQGARFWVQQFADLFFPRSQLTRQWKLWKLVHKRQLTSARNSSRLLEWLIVSTISWYLIFLVSIVWGARDFGMNPFPPFISIPHTLIPGCGGTCVPFLDKLQAPGYIFGAINLPARLIGLSTGMAQVKYYQNILAGLTTKPMRGWLACVTEVTLRSSAVASLIPILICNLYQPNWWLIMFVAVYVTVVLNNILCYQLARHTLESARGVLSTVPPSDDLGLKAFGTWGPNMAAYMVLLLAIWIGLQTHFLHDEWVYVISTIGVSVFVWCISGYINLAPSVRGSLSRAFIAGERLEAIAKR